MSHLLTRVGISVSLLGAIWALCAPGAAAQPASGPRETVNQQFTTTHPGTPTGLSFTGTFHAAGDPSGNPPYMRRVVFDPPRGMRYHTGVPALCTAPDPALQVLGPSACPAASRLGTGTAEGIFYEPVAHDFILDHFKHRLFVLNGKRQQILLVKSEGYTVVRGHIRDDGSLAFSTPSCFPAPPTGCADDYILQLATSTTIAKYTRVVNGQLRTYARTPSRCPDRGYWRTRFHFSWSDGSRDTVVSRQPCSR
jgi:hypothetical protein